MEWRLELRCLEGQLIVSITYQQSQLQSKARNPFPLTILYVNNPSSTYLIFHLPRGREEVPEMPRGTCVHPKESEDLRKHYEPVLVLSAHIQPQKCSVPACRSDTQDSRVAVLRFFEM